MSTMRAYTREFRESAIGLVLLEVPSMREATDDPGMRHYTLHGWLRTARQYAFIHDERAGASAVRTACRLLEVSPGDYYRFLKAPVAARKVRELAVEDAVVRIRGRASLPRRIRPPQHRVANHAAAWNTGEIRQEVAPDNDAERTWQRRLPGPARTQLRRRRPEPEVAERHHLHPDGRGLPEPRWRDGRLEPPHLGLEHVRRAAHGGRAQEPAARACAPLRPGRAVRLSGVPRPPRGSRHAAEHERIRQSLLQRDDGEPLGNG
jgi:hypothetical protein